MSEFTTFNLILTIVLVVICLFLINSKKQLLAICRTACLVTMLSYPWDYFAVQNGVWTYGDPGPLLFGVPFNDSVFIFVCTFFAAAVLSARDVRGLGWWKDRTQRQQQ